MFVSVDIGVYSVFNTWLSAIGPVNTAGIQYVEGPVYTVFFIIGAYGSETGLDITAGSDRIPVYTVSGLWRFYCM